MPFWFISMVFDIPETFLKTGKKVLKHFSKQSKCGIRYVNLQS